MKVLVIEDSKRLRRSLEHGLKRANFTVDLVADGLEGLGQLRAYEYDVVVLDLMLPGMSGLDILAQLRNTSQVHVLILSARDQVEDRIRGLELGADDYLVKPFDFGELVARIQALVRRRYQRKNPRLEFGPMVIDTAQRKVERAGETVQLTPSEYKILLVLAQRPRQVFSKTVLLDQLYRSDATVSENVIEVLMSSLRRKIQSPDEPPVIITRRGHGYMLNPGDGT